MAPVPASRRHLLLPPLGQAPAQAPDDLRVPNGGRSTRTLQALLPPGDARLVHSAGRRELTLGNACRLPDLARFATSTDRARLNEKRKLSAPASLRHARAGVWV
jgi:hypothetical protein